MLFAYATPLDGWTQGSEGPRHRRRGLAAPLRRGRRQRARHVLADSSGELHVLDAGRLPRSSFNEGSRYARSIPNVHPGAQSYSSVDPPREVAAEPGIGDIDGDTSPRSSTRGRARLRLELDGSTGPGFPGLGALDPCALAAPGPHTRDNHIKRGFSASPTLGDLDGDGASRSSLPALDQHVYAWDGNGNPLPGFPKKLRDAAIGREIITTGGARRHHGDGEPDIVTPTQEFDDNPSAPPTPAAHGRSFSTSSRPGQRARRQRPRVRGRPRRQRPARLADGAERDRPDALPLVGPGVDHVLANVDSDPELEVDRERRHRRRDRPPTATAQRRRTYDSSRPTGEHVDKEKVSTSSRTRSSPTSTALAGPR